MRDLSSTSEIMSRRSSNVEPITLPAPAMFSRRGFTVLVAAWARLRDLAIRVMAEGRGEGPVAPGLDGLVWVSLKRSKSRMSHWKL